MDTRRHRRSLGVVAAVAMLAGACSSAPEVIEAGTGSAGTEVDETTTTTVPLEVTDDEAVATTVVAAPAGLLLTDADLPDWQLTGEMSIGAEPPWVADNCDRMNEAWAAHAEPGRRVRGSRGDVSFRQTVVEMADEAAATAVLDAAADAWERCPGFAAGATDMWLEPFDAPATEGWRSEVLVVGMDEMVWTIGYWQRGAEVVLLDVDSPFDWDSTRTLLDATAARLAGDPVGSGPGNGPATTVTGTEVPTTAAPASTETTPGTAPTTSAVPRTEPVSDDPLAEFLPDASVFGPGWYLADIRSNEGEPGGQPLQADCPVVSPPVPPGIESRYEHPDSFLRAIEVILARGDGVGAALIDAFLALGGCPAGSTGFERFEVQELQVPRLDAAVGVDVGEGDDIAGSIVIAVVDDLLIGVYAGGTPDDPPLSIDDLAAVAATIGVAATS